MPIYEYKCPECGQTLERLEKIVTDSNDKAAPVLICDSGHEEAVMRRIISSEGGFILKGNWYKNNKSY